jgi:hypothetical protein
VSLSRYLDNTILGHIFSKKNKGCVTLWPCNLTLKSILRQKKNDGNSNISPPPTNIIFKKILPKETKNPSRYILELYNN